MRYQTEVYTHQTVFNGVQGQMTGDGWRVHSFRLTAHNNWLIVLWEQDDAA